MWLRAAKLLSFTITISIINCHVALDSAWKTWHFNSGILCRRRDLCIASFTGGFDGDRILSLDRFGHFLFDAGAGSNLSRLHFDETTQVDPALFAQKSPIRRPSQQAACVIRRARRGCDVSQKKAQGLTQTCDYLLQYFTKLLDLFKRVVEVETGSATGANAKLLMKRHRAVMTSPNRDALVVEQD